MYYDKMPSGYVQVPRTALYKIERLNIKNYGDYFAVLLFLCQHYDLKTHDAHPSELTMAKSLNFGKNKIEKILSDLEKCGCIKCKKYYKKVTHYVVIDYIDKTKESEW